MVKRSDSDCLLEETSFEGAAGSLSTTTAPGAPGVFEGDLASSSPSLSPIDIMERCVERHLGGGVSL